MVELLAPAGNLETLKTAVRYGADAVYIGGEAFSLRAGADNFSNEDMKEAVSFCHEYGRKLYVTANIFAHNEDIEPVKEYLKELKNIKPDALLISDPGIYSLEREICPEIPVHISTQANNTNYETVRFWKKMGAERVVLGRELSLKEIREIKDNIPEGTEIEAFVHGAMCISYSGRCLLSNFFTGRDANRGACTHPCRWKYAVMEENRPGEYLPIEENDRGTFLFHSKDLCMIEYLPEMIEAGIDSLKIEGRMKSELYVASVVRTYRNAIDDYNESPDKFKENIEKYKEEISQCTHRAFTTGFFFGKPDDSAQVYDSSSYENDAVYLGTVKSVDPENRAFLKQKNKFLVGDNIEIMKPDGRNINTKVLKMEDEKGNEMESCPHAGQLFHLTLEDAPEAGDVLRKRS